MTTLKNYIDAIPPLIPENISDLAGVGSFAAMNSVSLSSSAITGTLPPSKIRPFAGDATSSGYTLTLSPSGVAQGSYTNADITVDAKGRVTSASNGLATTITDTDYEVTDPARGVILRSPDGTRWRVTVDDSGALAATAL